MIQKLPLSLLNFCHHFSLHLFQYKSEETDRVDPSVISGTSSFLLPYRQSSYTPDLHNIPFPRTSGARCGTFWMLLLIGLIEYLVIEKLA